MIGKFFSMNEKRLERVVIGMNKVLARSQFAGELEKARTTLDFVETLALLRQELVDGGMEDIDLLGMPVFIDLLRHHSVLSGSRYFFHVSGYIEKLFKDKQALKDSESKDKIFKMVSEDEEFSKQSNKVWEDKEFVDFVKSFGAVIKARGYAGDVKANPHFLTLLRVHAHKSGELYFDIIMRYNLIEMVGRMVR